MAYTTHDIDTLSDFINLLDAEFSEYNGSVWYRGQSNANWKLLPSYLRTSDRASSESTLLAAFKQNAVMLTEKQPSNSFDWMFLMQHYGIPTRLLDWSESPLVALYFALDYTNADEDAVVWSLKPTELNSHAGITSAEEEFFIPSFDDEMVASYSIGQLEKGPSAVTLKPIATIATRNNVRIQAQLGVFTIHHKEDVPIEEIGDGNHVIKITIKKESKEKILNHLALLGINKFQLFPELASIKDTMIKRKII